MCTCPLCRGRHCVHEGRLRDVIRPCRWIGEIVLQCDCCISLAKTTRSVTMKLDALHTFRGGGTD